MDMKDHYTALEPCPHCGFHHYARSNVSRALAGTLARQEIKACGRERMIKQLPDEGLPKERTIA